MALAGRESEPSPKKGRKTTEKTKADAARDKASTHMNVENLNHDKKRVGNVKASGSSQSQTEVPAPEKPDTSSKKDKKEASQRKGKTSKTKLDTEKDGCGSQSGKGQKREAGEELATTSQSKQMKTSNASSISDTKLSLKAKGKKDAKKKGSGGEQPSPGKLDVSSKKATPGKQGGGSRKDTGKVREEQNGKEKRGGEETTDSDMGGGTKNHKDDNNKSSELEEDDDSTDLDEDKKLIRETERALRSLSGEWEGPDPFFTDFSSGGEGKADDIPDKKQEKKGKEKKKKKNGKKPKNDVSAENSPKRSAGDSPQNKKLKKEEKPSSERKAPKVLESSESPSDVSKQMETLLGTSKADAKVETKVKPAEEKGPTLESNTKANKENSTCTPIGKTKTGQGAATSSKEGDLYGEDVENLMKIEQSIQSLLALQGSRDGSPASRSGTPDRKDLEHLERSHRASPLVESKIATTPHSTPATKTGKSSEKKSLTAKAKQTFDAAVGLDSAVQVKPKTEPEIDSVPAPPVSSSSKISKASASASQVTCTTVSQATCSTATQVTCSTLPVTTAVAAAALPTITVKPGSAKTTPRGSPETKPIFTEVKNLVLETPSVLATKSNTPNFQDSVHPAATVTMPAGQYSVPPPLAVIPLVQSPAHVGMTTGVSTAASKPVVIGMAGTFPGAGNTVASNVAAQTTGALCKSSSSAMSVPTPSLVIPTVIVSHLGEDKLKKPGTPKGGLQTGSSPVQSPVLGSQPACAQAGLSKPLSPGVAGQPPQVRMTLAMAVQQGSGMIAASSLPIPQWSCAGLAPTPQSVTNPQQGAALSSIQGNPGVGTVVLPVAQQQIPGSSSAAPGTGKQQSPSAGTTAEDAGCSLQMLAEWSATHGRSVTPAFSGDVVQVSLPLVINSSQLQPKSGLTTQPPACQLASQLLPHQPQLLLQQPGMPTEQPIVFSQTPVFSQQALSFQQPTFSTTPQTFPTTQTILNPQAQFLTPQPTTQIPLQPPQISPQQPVLSPQQPLLSPQQPLLSPQQPLLSPQKPLVSPQQPQLSPQQQILMSPQPQSPHQAAAHAPSTVSSCSLQQPVGQNTKESSQISPSDPSKLEPVVKQEPNLSPSQLKLDKKDLELLNSSFDDGDMADFGLSKKGKNRMVELMIHPLLLMHSLASQSS